SFRPLLLLWPDRGIAPSAPCRTASRRAAAASCGPVAGVPGEAAVCPCAGDAGSGAAGGPTAVDAAPISGAMTNKCPELRCVRPVPLPIVDGRSLGMVLDCG